MSEDKGPRHFCVIRTEVTRKTEVYLVTIEQNARDYHTWGDYPTWEDLAISATLESKPIGTANKTIDVDFKVIKMEVKEND